MELKKAPRIFGVFFLTKKWKMSFCTSEVTIFFEKSFLVTKNGNRETRCESKSFKLLKKRGYQRLPKNGNRETRCGSKDFAIFLPFFGWLPFFFPTFLYDDFK